MRVVIHHAYFLPWLGYFGKLEFADALVILDNVGFRRTHINRVRIFDNRNKIAWLSLPVGNHWRASCDQVSLPSDHSYLRRLLLLLSHSYKHATAFDFEYPALSEVILSALTADLSLLEANIRMIVALRTLMQLPHRPLYRSSHLTKATDRTDRLIDICKRLQADELLIGAGRMADVHDLSRIKRSGIRIFQQDFIRHHPQYPQLHSRRSGSAFVPGLSVIDALFNVGASAASKLLSDRKLAPVEVLEG